MHIYDISIYCFIYFFYDFWLYAKDEKGFVFGHIQLGFDVYILALSLSLFHSVYIKSSENMFRFVYAMSEFSFRFTLYSPTICTLFPSVCHWKPVHSVCVFCVAGFCLFSHKPSAERLCCGIVFSVPSVCQLFRK